ncbi:MAG TPA: recombinase family protein [Micromonosporaceae bacterium]
MLDQGIDTSTAVGRMFFQILGAIAEFEHALMSERTLDGLAAARARGRTPNSAAICATVCIWRPSGPVSSYMSWAMRAWRGVSFGFCPPVTRPTIYRHLAQPAT